MTDNVDPLGLARLKLDVPAVPDTTDLWALPCIPYGGNSDNQVGFHVIPPIGAHVWVEFEAGDPSHPIWTGCYWDDKSEFPDPANLESEKPPLVKILKTASSSFIIDDADNNAGSVTLEIDSPAVEEKVTLVFDNNGASLTTGISSITVDPKNGITLKVEDTTIALTKDAIKLNSSEIDSTSTAATKVSAGSDLTLESTEATKASAGSSMDLEATGSLSAKASGSATIEGSASLDVSSSGVVSIKGSLININ